MIFSILYSFQALLYWFLKNLYTKNLFLGKSEKYVTPFRITDSLCRYCRSPLKQGRELTEQEQERLKSIVNAMEDTLRENENSSWILGICFAVLGAGTIAS